MLRLRWCLLLYSRPNGVRLAFLPSWSGADCSQRMEYRFEVKKEVVKGCLELLNDLHSEIASNSVIIATHKSFFIPATSCSHRPFSRIFPGSKPADVRTHSPTAIRSGPSLCTMLLDRIVCIYGIPPYPPLATKALIISWDREQVLSYWHLRLITRLRYCILHGSAGHNHQDSSGPLTGPKGIFLLDRSWLLGDTIYMHFSLWCVWSQILHEMCQIFEIFNSRWLNQDGDSEIL